ncbi:MAG: DUF3313 family protein [Pseudomonadota bacterium]
MNKKLFRTALFLQLLAMIGCASPPETTPDGLVLVRDSKFQQVYAKPGTTLDGFSSYLLETCDVSFRRNWLRDQNSKRLDLSNKVTQEDMDRIEASLEAECDKAFAAALLEEPAYPIADPESNASEVLVLAPSIINLNVNAPDTRSTTMQRTYTTSAGEMTLYLELLDGATGEVLAKVTDKQDARDVGRIQWSNSITNRFEADRILKRWGSRLRDGLDRATGAPE